MASSSLMALLSQQLPSLQTRKALVLTGLQNDFLSPDGKLPVSADSGYIEKLHEVVPAFREFGDVIWIKTQFDGNRALDGEDEIGDSVLVGPIVESAIDKEQEDDRESPVPFKRARVSHDADRSTTRSQSDESVSSKEWNGSDATQTIDEELFLTRWNARDPCCIPNSNGADFATQITGLMDKKDLRLTTTHYSAFGTNSLLLTLRSRLITELYVGGCMSNVSVFATAMDAARYGIEIVLLEDCLGYRKRERHESALKQLQHIMGAEIRTGENAINLMRNPPPPEEYDDEDEYEDEEFARHEANESVEITGHRSIKLGPDAEIEKTYPTSPAIEVDSDEEEEEGGLDELILQSPFLSSRLMKLQFASPGLAHQNPLQNLPSESTEVKTAVSHDGSIANQASGGDDGKAESHTKNQLQAASNADVELAATDESLHGINQNESWLEFLKSWDQPSKSPLQSVVEEMMDKDVRHRNSRTLEGKPLLGDDKESESAGSRILYDLLPPELAETIFDELKSEVTWQRMHHQTGEVPRLVCCQCTIDDDGSMPVYRHPSDQAIPSQPWTSAVDKVRKAAETAVGHPLNHALVQLYRSRTDYISEHSDKTLDIAKNSYIVNVSFGAQRTMRLRTKRTAASINDSTSPGRTTYRVQMPHNSMITMSLPTNAEYLHGINADKRPCVELADAETAFDGQRISLTFRNIGTFLDKDSSRIWGKGAKGKFKATAGAVVNGNAVESEGMIKAFGAENQASAIEWDAIYGNGFDVLHLK